MKDGGTPLIRFAWLSIAAAVATIALKFSAYLLTDSVGLLSDALESIVNLVAAVAALIALTIAQKEPDEDHAFGHAKAEYFSSGLEGGLIVVASVTIAATSIPRLLHPKGIEAVGVGLVVSSVATVINLVVAIRLRTAGRRYRSITLEADSSHLFVDVWTSVGVVVGVGAVVATGWNRLDAILALLIAVNIVRTGVELVQRSMLGLLDTAIPAEERRLVDGILAKYRSGHRIEAHALRTRQAGSRSFISVHILVPGDWSVNRGHALLEEIEGDILRALPNTSMTTHLESLDDPASWDDATLDRRPPGAAATLD